MAVPLPNVGKKEMERMNLLAEAYRSIQEKDYDKALKIAGRMFHDNHSDELVFEMKVMLLLQVDKVDDAYDMMIKFPKMSVNMQFEIAYCHYRKSEMEKAKEILDNWKEDNSLRKRELLSQIYYRLDRYEEAYDMMRDLIKVSDDDMDNEREANLSAIVACLKLTGSTKEVPPVLGDTYELEYNHATGLIGEGKIEEAEALLSKAEKFALETLTDEEAPEEDIADEVGLVSAQKAYCAQITDREKEAMNIYTNIMKMKPTDPALIAVVSNNVICINGEQNLFDSKKRVRYLTADNVQSKLNRAQRRSMWFNEYMLNFHSQNYPWCEKILPDYIKLFPEAEDDHFELRVSHLAKTKGVASSLRLIDSVIPKDADKSLILKLGLCQQVWKEGNRELPLSLMKDLAKTFVYPGIVGAIVTIYQYRQNTYGAATAMKLAVDHYRKTGRDNKNLTMLWRQMACLMIEHEEYEEAAQTLEELRVNEPDDGITLAQLIVAYSQFDTLKAKALAHKLPPFEESEIDANILESPNWLANMKTLKKGGKPESLVSSPIINIPSEVLKTPREKKKKKKKAKVPANYDPNRTPDPERWIPRFERTGYRPKKTRKGRVDVGKGTQGADTVASAIYDMSGKVGQRGSAAQEESPATSAWRKDGNKKKKNRSRR